METLKIANNFDLAMVGAGRLAPEQVRRIEVQALVDTGASFPALPRHLIRELGLTEFEMIRVRTAGGVVMRRKFVSVRAEVLGRATDIPVIELDDDVPPLIGALLLQSLDLVVNPTRERAMTNPDHNGEWIVYALLSRAA